MIIGISGKIGTYVKVDVTAPIKYIGKTNNYTKSKLK